MFTQCRGCGEIFKTTVDDLITASGMVRCSSCGTVFNALDTLSEYKPQKTRDLILHENDNPPPLLTHESKVNVVAKKPVRKTPIQSRQRELITARPQSVKKVTKETELAKISAKQENNEDEVFFNVKPDFVMDNEQAHSKKPVFIWLLLSITVVAGLLWQASIALKNGSLQLPDNELKTIVCAQIECYTRIKQTNPDKIALVSRSIRQHPGRDNALIITTGIINSDKDTQLFPALQVKMSNLNGEIVAMRRFLPSEYIDEDTINAGMLPNVLIPITLELQSPGKSAVTFEVGFSPTYGEI